MPTEANRPPRHDQRVIGNRIGENTSNNEFASDQVAANADGSIFERLEAIKDQVTTADTVVDAIATQQDAMDGSTPATFFPGLGYRVTKVADLATTLDLLFATTGKVAVTLLHGEVTSVLATTTSLQLKTSVGGVVMHASTDVVNDALGTLYMVTGDPDDTLNGGNAPTLHFARTGTGNQVPMIFNNEGINQQTDQVGTGFILWECHYMPLEAGASVASVA